MLTFSQLGKERRGLGSSKELGNSVIPQTCMEQLL